MVMKSVKIVGLTLIVLMLISMMPLNNIHAESQVNIKVKIYKDILNRALSLPYLTPDIKKEIQDILNMQPKTPEEISNMISKANSVLNEISRLAEGRSDIGKMIEESRVTVIINILIDIAREANETEAVSNLTSALKMVNKGNLEGAKSILAMEMKHIENIKMQRSSKALEETVTNMLQSLSSNKTAVEAVIKAISNVNITISILENVKTRLIKTNASENAIKAIDRAIANLNTTTAILESVAKVVETAGVSKKAGNITKSIASSWILDDIKDLRIDINKLLNETTVIEVNLNISLSNIKDILINASNLLNQSESLVKEEYIGKALGILAHVKVVIKSVEKVLEKYKETMEKSLEEKGKLKEYVEEEFKELMKCYNESLSEYKYLYNSSISLNSTEALKHLIEANKTLSEVTSIIVEIEVYINQSSYDNALKLINKAESKLSSLSKIFNKVEDILKIVKKTVEEIIDEIKDLKEELNELVNYANSTLSGSVLNITIEKIVGLENKLDEALMLAENGSIEHAGMIIKSIKFKTSNLTKCVEKVGDVFKEILNLNETISELMKKYSGSKEAMKNIMKAMKLLNQSRSMCITAIVKININVLKNVEKILKNIKNMLESLTENNRIMFMAVDTMGRPVWNATIVFGGDEYYSGEVAFKPNGTYTLETGVIPSGYTFAYWKAKGDVKIDDYTSNSTNATIYGDSMIIMVLNRTVSKEYTINFYVKDIEGNIIENATIVFNGTEYYNGNSTKVPIGEYSIKVGAVPDGYKFSHWMSMGKVIIKNPMSKETKVIIRGDGSITMILSKEVGKAYEISFHILDGSGKPVKEASIIFNGEEYYNGNSTKVYAGAYLIKAGNIPNGYKFSRWESSNNITIMNNNSRTTLAYINGSGDITLILSKKVSTSVTVKFNIIDTEGNPVLNASIEFNGVIFHSGGNITVSVGVYIIKTNVIPNGYVFNHWEVKGNASINDSRSPVTKVSISGDCIITLVLEKTSRGGSSGSISKSLNHFISIDLIDKYLRI